MQPENIVRALGDLEGTVRSLSKTVNDMANQWGQQEATAKAGRGALYGRFESLSNEFSSIKSMLEGVQEDTAEIKKDIDEQIMPTVRAYNLDQARRGGFNSFGKLLWGAFLALVAAAGYGIHQIVSLFSHHL